MLRPAFKCLPLFQDVSTQLRDVQHLVARADGLPCVHEQPCLDQCREDSFIFFVILDQYLVLGKAASQDIDGGPPVHQPIAG